MARLMGLATIAPKALHERMQRRETIAIYDLNPPASWLAARVPGARRLDPGNWVEGDLSPDKAQPLVFYCSNPLCRKAPLAARRARQMGFAAVSVLSAGITGWCAAGLPVQSGAGQ